MVPCFAIGLTGLLVTSVGRSLLFAGHGPATVLAMALTVVIMVGGTIATYVIPRRRVPRTNVPARH